MNCSLAKFVAFLLTAVAVAAALRLPHLDVRPMHADESVQAVLVRDLWQQGDYVYNPHEFHGPTLPYATLPFVEWSGATSFADTTEATYRIVPVLFGIGCVLLFWLFRGLLDDTALLIAAGLAAVSPALVFYSRYFIHEMLLAFFTLAAIGCGWRYILRRRWVWCVLTGLCVGCMQATKETAAIAYLGAAGAAVVVLAWNRVAGRPWEPLRRDVVWHLVAGMLAAVVTASVLLTSFGADRRGVLDGVLTYLPWLSRAGGESPHIYPWWFYLKRLCWWHAERHAIWSEAPLVVLAALGLLYALRRRPAEPVSGSDERIQVHFARWLASYSLIVCFVYCVIPYKTPWCLTQFLIVWLLLAGAGGAWLLRARRRWWRVIIAVLLVGGAGYLGWQAYRASFQFPADPGNPYVLSQTSADVERFVEHVRGVAAVSPSHWRTPVKVIWTDAYYWPLPWYLRQFEQVELWRELPADPVAPLVVAAPQYNAQLEEALGRDYIMLVYELRPQVIMQLWVRFELWESYLRSIGRVQ